MPEQYCPKCEKTKELSARNFYRDSSTDSGFSKNHCKICCKAYHDERRKNIKRTEGYGLSATQAGVVVHRTPDQDAFDKACMQDRFRRLGDRGTSIDKAV